MRPQRDTGERQRQFGRSIASWVLAAFVPGFPELINFRPGALGFWAAMKQFEGHSFYAVFGRNPGNFTESIRLIGAGFCMASGDSVP